MIPTLSASQRLTKAQLAARALHHVRCAESIKASYYYDSVKAKAAAQHSKLARAYTAELHRRIFQDRLAALVSRFPVRISWGV
jgi:hypothetical protein